MEIARYRLAFGATFYFDRSVPAKDNGASLSTIDPAAAAQNGAVSFATTHWSMVLTAQGESRAAEEALDKLCRIYWRPLYGFARRQGLGPEDAQDLIQQFFAGLLRRQNFRTIRQEKGRLRSYLLVSLKRFLASEQHRANGVKRYETGLSIPLDELFASDRADSELTQILSPDELYERRWVLSVLGEVLDRLEVEYRAAGKGVLFDRLKESLVGDAHGPLQAEIAAELYMTENAVKQAFHRFRQRYRLLLREQIALTVAQPGEVEDELRHFASVLRR